MSTEHTEAVMSITAVGGGLARYTIETGPCGDWQESNFMNATLQGDGSGEVEFSIAMHVKIDAAELAERWPDLTPVERVARRLDLLLGHLASEGGGDVEFHAVIGPEGDGGLDADDGTV